MYATATFTFERPVSVDLYRAWLRHRNGQPAPSQPETPSTLVSQPDLTPVEIAAIALRELREQIYYNDTVNADLPLTAYEFCEQLEQAVIHLEEKARS